uniref:Uncharacterized protein n=1 Tax=Tetranychus urticae TaxID=32264 RepID=T1L1V3_TETUR
MTKLFEISKVCFTEGLLNEKFNTLNIERSEIFNIEETMILYHKYATEEQIVTFEFDRETGCHEVRTYNSAKELFLAKKNGLLSGPDDDISFRYGSDIDFAFKCNWLKFRQNKHFADELLQTGRQFLVYYRRPEGKKAYTTKARAKRDWPDITAKILMIIREDLRRQAEQQASDAAIKIILATYYIDLTDTMYDVFILLGHPKQNDRTLRRCNLLTTWRMR